MILPYDFAPQQFDPGTLNLSKNLENLEAKFSHLDAVILTSKDPFLSEYVPLINNPRYAATGFTGSVGDAIYWTQRSRAKNALLKPVSLFVDGRYHLQADLETDPERVEVVKVDVEPNIEGLLRKRLLELKATQIGIDFERTSIAALTRYQALSKELGAQLNSISGEEVLSALHLKGWKVERPIFSLAEADTGRTLHKTLTALSDEIHAKFGTLNAMLITAATDDAAFLLNARAYHLPHTASMLAYTFFIGDLFIVFLPASSKHSPVEIDPKQLGHYRLKVIRDDLTELRQELSQFKVDHLIYNASTMNGLLPTLVQEMFPDLQQHSDFDWIIKNRARKTEAEKTSIRKSFIRSSRAIAQTLRWAKAESQIKKVSEVDLADQLYQNYAKEGAVALSFKTISGAGANSAIIHYSTPSRQEFFDAGKLALLDSGAYYAEGYCTDCTRGFFVGDTRKGDQPADWQKEIYTATLKSAIQVFMSPVDAQLSGREVDQMIRSKVKEAGYDYMHGTGHGIGIHVHEDGIRLSTLSTYPQSDSVCVSVEPGIYLNQQGGVRVENVALLSRQGDQYHYENVVYVGYDWDLVDVSKLTIEERTYLKDYEAKCRELGTHLTDCPLSG